MEELLRGGRYQLLGKLGEGAQGTTFDAIDRREGRPVAIKRFQVRGASSWKDVELAEREATVLSQLSHPSLPAHIDHFEEDGSLYLVMDKIEGQSLAALTRSGGMLAQADVLRFLSDVSSVLTYLHGRSPPVIHRDINPKNVIRKPDGSFALVDFGAVRDRLRPEGGSTVVGTFGYMAPEQFQGRALAQSDVYAVGATAIRLLTGVEPENLPHKGLAIDVPTALGRAAEPALRSALERMLEPDPDRRAASLGPIVEKLTRQKPGDTSGTRRKSREQDAAAHARNRKTSRDEWEDWVGVAEWMANDVGQRVSRKARRAAQKAARRARRHARRRGRLPWPLLVFAVIALFIAGRALRVTLGVLVPVALILLGVFIGPALRRAAGRVRDAGDRAARRVDDARDSLLRPEITTSYPAFRVETPHPRQRVHLDDHDDDVLDAEGVEVKSPRSRQG